MRIQYIFQRTCSIVVPKCNFFFFGLSIVLLVFLVTMMILFSLLMFSLKPSNALKEKALGNISIFSFYPGCWPLKLGTFEISEYHIFVSPVRQNYQKFGSVFCLCICFYSVYLTFWLNTIYSLENMAPWSASLLVLVCLCCCNKVWQIAWLNQKKCFVLQFCRLIV